MRIAGAAVREWRLRILDGVSRFMDAVDGEDQPIKIFAARGFHTLDFIDVIRRVTSMSGPERARRNLPGWRDHRRLSASKVPMDEVDDLPPAPGRYRYHTRLSNNRS